MTIPPITADQIAELVATGAPYWWLRDGTYIATHSAQAEIGSDIYVLAATEAWLSQFNEDWQACADLLNPLLERDFS